MMMSMRTDPPVARQAPTPAPAHRLARTSHEFDEALREGDKMSVPETDETSKDEAPQGGVASPQDPSSPAIALDTLLAQISPGTLPAASRMARSGDKEDESAQATPDARPSGESLEKDVLLPAMSQLGARSGGAGDGKHAADPQDKPTAGTFVPQDRGEAQGRHGRSGEEADATLSPTRAVAVTSVTAGQHFPVVGDPVRQIASEVKQAIEATRTTAVPEPATSSVKTLNVQLEPESLGTVTLRMRLSGNQLSIRVDVAEPATLDMIQRERDRLQKSMTSESVSIDQLEIRSTREPAPVTSGDNANATRQDANPQGQASRQNDGAAGHGTQQRREARADAQTGQDSRHGHENSSARGAESGGVYL